MDYIVMPTNVVWFLAQSFSKRANSEQQQQFPLCKIYISTNRKAMKLSKVSKRDFISRCAHFFWQAAPNAERCVLVADISNISLLGQRCLGKQVGQKVSSKQITILNAVAFIFVWLGITTKAEGFEPHIWYTFIWYKTSARCFLFAARACVCLSVRVYSKIWFSVDSYCTDSSTY